MLSKTDANQASIVRNLRSMGFMVFDLHKVGKGFPDVLVSGYSNIDDAVVNVLVEIKTEKGKLNEGQKQWHSKYRSFFMNDGRVPLLVAQDVDDVLEWFGKV